MNFAIDYPRFQSESRITTPAPEVVKEKKDRAKNIPVQRGSMMWEFVSEALMRRRYGPNLHTVQKKEKRWVFAVRAVNQKAFQPHQVGLKDESWALFLDYGKLKGRRKPETSEEYTKLRSTFFNGIIRCACDGIISKVDRQTASELGITLYKDYKYFMYEGEDLSKYQREYTYEENASAFSRNNGGDYRDNASSEKYQNHEHSRATEYEGPLPEGDYLFSVQIGKDGEVLKTSLLGAMPDNYNVNVPSMDVSYEFVNSKKMRIERSEENAAILTSHDQMYYSEPSQDSDASDKDVNAAEVITDVNNLIADLESTPIVVKLEPEDIVAPSDSDNEIEECDERALNEQIKYMNPAEREHYASKRGLNRVDDQEILIDIDVDCGENSSSRDSQVSDLINNS